MNFIIIPIFIPHYGCPYTCVFCNQNRITGQESTVKIQEVPAIIENYLATIAGNSGQRVEVAFYGGSFTALEPAIQEAYLQVVQPYLEQGVVTSLRVSTRPDAITPEILSSLDKYGVQTIELGVQSLDREVLKLSGRGYTVEAVRDAARLIRAGGFTLGIQLMVGLPGDNRNKDLETVRQVVELKPAITRIYPTLVIADTQLYRMYVTGRYKPLPLEEAVSITADMFLVLARAGIKVIRMGLQPTPELIEGQGLVAGPFHPGFGELVESEVFFRQAVCALNTFFKGQIPSDFNIFVNQRDLSKMVGQRGLNRGRLQECFAIDRPHIKGITANSRDWVGVSPGEAEHPYYILERTEFYDRYELDRDYNKP